MHKTMYISCTNWIWVNQWNAMLPNFCSSQNQICKCINCFNLTFDIVVFLLLLLTKKLSHICFKLTFLLSSKRAKLHLCWTGLLKQELLSLIKLPHFCNNWWLTCFVQILNEFFEKNNSLWLTCHTLHRTRLVRIIFKHCDW